jgi:hypothetical protein
LMSSNFKRVFTEKFHIEGDVFEKRRKMRAIHLVVVAYGLDRATLHSLFALSFFVWSFWLPRQKCMAIVIIHFKIIRRRSAAGVASDTLSVDEELTWSVLRILVSLISHLIVIALTWFEVNSRE